MIKRILCLAMASAFASGSAWAESHRLAFSKSEQIEIYVEHATGASWCSPTLDMRVVYLAEPKPSALATLMPKLGALLDQQCPVATAVNWKSADAKGDQVARGTSSKATNWALASEPVKLAVTELDAVVAPPATAPPLAEIRKEAPAPEAATKAQTQTAPAIAVPAVEAPTIPAPAAASVAAPPAAPVLVPTPAPAPAPAPASAPVQAPEPVAATADFTINGWKPQTDAEVRAQSKLLTVMQDQNGCKILSWFKLGEGAQYVSLKSEGLTCGPDGFAAGKGRLMLERSDGAVLARTNNVWFATGIPFSKELTAARLAATDDEKTLWLHLGHDAPSQSYFLLRAEVSNYSGIGVWKIDPRIDVVTANDTVFRQADAIKSVILASLTALHQSAMPWTGSSRLIFASDFKKGIAIEDQKHLLYAIDVHRPTNWRTGRAEGQWPIDLRRGRNYVFQRDEQLAQEKRMQEQQEARLRRAKLMEQANNERSKLSTYESLVGASSRGPEKVLADLQNDVDYKLLVGGRYNRLVDGKKMSITRIVRVNGSDGDDAKVDWPYDMRLVGQKALKNQWYMVKGEVSLDGKRFDNQNLPLTMVTATAKEVLPCAKEGCLDMAEPLTVARLRFGQPDWTPEAARAVIDQATQP